MTCIQGLSHRVRGGKRHAPPPLQFPNQQLQFQFTGVQKLYGLEISRFLPCTLQFWANYCRFSFFLTTLGK